MWVESTEDRGEILYTVVNGQKVLCVVNTPHAVLLGLTRRDRTSNHSGFGTSVDCPKTRDPRNCVVVVVSDKTREDPSVPSEEIIDFVTHSAFGGDGSRKGRWKSPAEEKTLRSGNLLRKNRL